jgi:hypothetical protein
MEQNREHRNKSMYFQPTDFQQWLQDHILEKGKVSCAGKTGYPYTKKRN